jgi:hypothetical protein
MSYIDAEWAPGFNSTLTIFYILPAPVLKSQPVKRINAAKIASSHLVFLLKKLKNA